MWWVDESFWVVHWDSKEHTEPVVSMGKDAAVNIARTHNMHVTSSAGSELVSISNVLGMILYYTYFMEA